MRDTYLLAAGLLTGLAIPASALPQLSIILPELETGQHATLKQKIIPSIQISLPEFSSQGLLATETQQLTTNEKSNPNREFTNQGLLAPTEPSVNSNSQTVNQQLISGSQLYYERLAALKTGKSYTGSDDNRFQSLSVTAKKNQLSYEDWKILLALEAKALAQGQGGNRLSILVGDSLSMWFPKEKLPAGKLWLNQGISGDTSSGVFKRLSAFSQTRPDVIYLMAGINDLRKNSSDETILRNHRRIIHQLRKTHPDSLIIVESILPTRIPTIANSRIRRINEQIALIAKQEGANYLNIHNWFTDSQGNLREDLTTDGLHLSSRGYDVWRWALEQIELKLTVSRIKSM